MILSAMLSRGGDYAEIFLEETRRNTLHFEDGRKENFNAGYDRGAGLRLIQGDTTHYTSSQITQWEALRQIGKELARGLPKNPAVPAPELHEPTLPPPTPIKRFPADVPLKEKIAKLDEADHSARAYDKRIMQVNVVYGESIRKIQIAHSDGVFTADQRILTTFYVEAIAAWDKQIFAGREVISGTVGFELFEDTPASDVAEAAAREAIFQLDARPAPAGTFPVVLSSSAGGTMVHEACGHGLEADFIEQGLSLYAEKQGELVASALITVLDDGTLPKRRGSDRIDDEGYPTQSVVLIEQGRLKGFLQSRDTALKLGQDRTGNARRESYRYPPIPRMRNTMIAPGKTKPEEILSSVKEGIYVAKMGGGEVDIVTGQFVFSISEGYLIKDGRLADPIRGATLTGKGPRILQSIDMVGSDLGFEVGTCGKDGQGVPVADAQPTLRIPAIVIGGIVEKDQSSGDAR